MPPKSTLESMERPDVAVEVTSQTHVSEDCFTGSNSSNSDVQKEESINERTDSDETFSNVSCDELTDDDDDYYNGETSDDTDVSQGRHKSRPARKITKPDRFSPGPQRTKGQAPKGRTRKTTTKNQPYLKGKDSEDKKRSTMTKTKLRNNITGHVEKRRELAGKILELKEEAGQKDARISELTDALIEAEQAVQQITTQSLKLLDKHNTFAMPDEIVREEFRDIFSACKRWATKWVKLPSDLSSDDSDQLVSLLSEGDFATARLIRALQEGKVPLKIILNAMLNRIMTVSLFARPFGHLMGLDPQQASNFEVALNWVQDVGEKAIGTDANLWRAMTIRMLYPAGHTVDGPSEQDREKEIANLELVWRNRIKDDVGGRLSMLLRDCTEKELSKHRAELSEILLAAQNFSTRLHAQDVEIRTSLLEGIHKRLGNQFSSTSEHTRPHRALKLDDDDGGLSTELDGEEIDLVIEPLVQGRVVEQGRVAEGYKDWHKAVVWVVKEVHLKKEETVEEETVAEKPKAASSKVQGKGISTNALSTKEGHATSDTKQASSSTQLPGANLTESKENSIPQQASSRDVRPPPEAKIQDGKSIAVQTQPPYKKRRSEELQEQINEPASKKPNAKE